MNLGPALKTATPALLKAGSGVLSDAGVDAPVATIAGAVNLIDLAKNGFHPDSSADQAKLVSIIAGGMALVPGVGTALAGATLGLYKVGKLLACPTIKFFHSIGLGTLPPECGGKLCEHKGPPTTPTQLLSKWNLGALPSGSFRELAMTTVAMNSASKMNCANTMAPDALVDALVVIWNKTHAGPIVNVLVPPFDIFGEPLNNVEMVTPQGNIPVGLFYFGDVSQTPWASGLGPLAPSMTGTGLGLASRSAFKGPLGGSGLNMFRRSSTMGRTFNAPARLAQVNMGPLIVQSQDDAQAMVQGAQMNGEFDSPWFGHDPSRFNHRSSWFGQDLRTRYQSQFGGLQHMPRRTKILLGFTLSGLGFGTLILGSVAAGTFVGAPVGLALGWYFADNW